MSLKLRLCFALNYRIGRILCLLSPGHVKDLELGGTWEQHHRHGTRAHRFPRDARRAHPLFTRAAPLPGQGPGGGAKQSQCPKAGPGSAAQERGPGQWGRVSVSAEMPELRSGVQGGGGPKAFWVKRTAHVKALGRRKKQCLQTA